MAFKSPPVPQLPGYRTQGKSLDEVMERIREEIGQRFVTCSQFGGVRGRADSRHPIRFLFYRGGPFNCRSGCMLGLD